MSVDTRLVVLALIPTYSCSVKPCLHDATFNGQPQLLSENVYRQKIVPCGRGPSIVRHIVECFTMFELFPTNV